MADGIHELTATGCQKKPPEELIVSWITGSWSDISERKIKSSFLKYIQNIPIRHDNVIFSIQNMIFFLMIVWCYHFFCFLLALFFLF